MVGRKMQMVVDLVALHPGQPKLFYARRVGPHGSLKYGYETVNRVIKVGLVLTEAGKGLRTLLFPLAS